MSKYKKVHKDEKNDHYFSIRMPRELFILAKTKAMREYRSLAEVVRELLREWLSTS